MTVPLNDLLATGHPVRFTPLRPLDNGNVLVVDHDGIEQEVSLPLWVIAKISNLIMKHGEGKEMWMQKMTRYRQPIDDFKMFSFLVTHTIVPLQEAMKWMPISNPRKVIEFKVELSSEVDFDPNEETIDLHKIAMRKMRMEGADK